MSGQIINDPNALDQYIDLMGEEGSEFIIDIIDTFLESAPDSFTLLDHSLATNDPATFRRAAHTLKTGCSTVGATVLAKNFLKLEEAGETGSLTSIRDLLEHCKREYKLLKTELDMKKSAWQ